MRQDLKPRNVRKLGHHIETISQINPFGRLRVCLKNEYLAETKKIEILRTISQPRTLSSNILAKDLRRKKERN